MIVKNIVCLLYCVLCCYFLYYLNACSFLFFSIVINRLRPSSCCCKYLFLFFHACVSFSCRLCVYYILSLTLVLCCWKYIGIYTSLFDKLELYFRIWDRFFQKISWFINLNNIMNRSFRTVGSHFRMIKTISMKFISQTLIIVGI